MGPINVLIGANGSGKSNFVSFFKMISEMANERLQVYIGQSGGANSVAHLGSKMTPRIEVELVFKTQTGFCHYKFYLVHAASDSLIFDEERLIPVVSGPKAIWISTGG
ncbi:MAG TPA: AAA family ATPase, partial [Isosphaeraceae bacterium]|nr:AAA family ATPase [Isosphaeraceae bacterium]